MSSSHDPPGLAVDRFALIARVARIITSGLELEALLQNAADAIHDLLHYPNVDIPLVDPEDPGTLVVRNRGGLYKRLIRHEDRLSIHQGIMGSAARERLTQLVNDVSVDPRYVRPPGTSGIRAELAVPILLGGEVLGVLNVESEEAFGELDVASLEIVADHLAVAINNARLFERAQRAAVLEERQRLARDLHDSVTQMLTSLNMIAQTLAPAWRRDPAEGERRTERLAELARSALAEMRALLRELRPAPAPSTVQTSEILIAGIVQLRRFGLGAALQRLAKDVPPDGPKIRLELGAWEPQAFEVEEALFRVAQEALSNALRHARARQVRIAAAVEDPAARLQVRDDGEGFDPAARVRRTGNGGLGLLSMRERIEALGGSLRVETAPGKGTLIEAMLPSRRRESS
ncbi:MAG TPA: GAF domain-containing sensor histidine kinase [Thermoanaerobaculia bacterium]